LNSFLILISMNFSCFAMLNKIDSKIHTKLEKNHFLFNLGIYISVHTWIFCIQINFRLQSCSEFSSTHEFLSTCTWTFLLYTCIFVYTWIFVYTCSCIWKFMHTKVQTYNYKLYIKFIEVGSPTCLGLVCYTSWVKRWSKAMDFLQKWSCFKFLPKHKIFLTGVYVHDFQIWLNDSALLHRLITIM